MAMHGKSRHEEFAKFFDMPTREGLRNLLKGHGGESKYLDFKETWPDYSDVARHILGMGNVGGGCIVLGVKEEPNQTLVPVGLDSFHDKADIGKGVSKFLPHDLFDAVETVDFNYSETEYAKIAGMKFQVVFVSPDMRKSPFVCCSEGKKISRSVIYIRREAATEPASHDEIQQLLNDRIETNYSSSKDDGSSAGFRATQAALS